MKLSFLESFEEKFYFKTSHYFWHLLTGLGGLALVIGVLVLLWGIIPSFKPGVKKPKYPDTVKVTAEEIQTIIHPAPKTTDEAATTTDKEKPAEEAKTIDPAEKAYLAAIDSMKRLLPPEKYRWESRGHWERGWYRNRWVVDSYGIEDRLKTVYNNTNADNFTTQKQLLDAYIALIALFPEENRYSVLRAALDYSKGDVSTTVSNTELLKASVKNYSTDNADFIEALATFGRKNPRDGQAFIEYSNSIMPKFDQEIKSTMLSTLISSYYKHFNLIERQQEATDLFLGMLDQFKPEDQSKALAEYYRLYVGKNYERSQKVAELERQYEYDQEHAESVLAQKKAKNAGYRILGLKTIGSSIVFIAFVALFLVLLSIQRNVKMLRDEAGK